jgi:2',3'-cyclic-nucleotide 2'-phosphodiesterase/3'-nucleotidase
VYKLLIFLFLSITTLCAQDRSKLIILHTTDVHGNINPYNYFSDAPANNGLARVYTLVKQYRIRYNNVLLLDSGDLIQGTPLSYYFNHIERQLPNPLIFSMNYMKYDAFTIGNHDIEQGYHVYYKAREESHFPWLSANCLRSDNSSHFESFTIIQKGSIKIGIIGLTTPAIPMWLDKMLYPGLEWQDMVKSAQKWAEMLKPRVDVLIGLFHAGMNSEYSRARTEALDLPNENASRLIAESVPAFDVILCGHSHRRYPYNEGDETTINGVLMLMSGSHARFLGVAELDLQKEQNNKWEIIGREGYILNVDTVDPAEEILAINDVYHQKTLNYIREIVGSVADTISGKLSRMQDNPMVQFINNAQIFATHTSISFAASFNDRFFLPPGEIRVKDIYNMYRYENFLYVIEMSGQQIKDYLEYSSNYFQFDSLKNEIRINSEMAGYNYDMAEGLAYTIDATKKPGNRIQNLTEVKTGLPLNMTQSYPVAMNSYRASGGGGHLAAAGIKNAKIIWKSNKEIRNILIDYIQESGNIETRVDNNWQLKIAN